MRIDRPGGAADDSDQATEPARDTTRQLPLNADSIQPFLSRAADRERQEARAAAVQDRQGPVNDDRDASTEELKQFVEDDEAAYMVGEARDNPKEYADTRSAELQEQVPEKARGWITMGVGVGTDAEGGTRVVVGTSEARGYLREGVTLRPGEERSREPGHAEVSILKYMAGRDIVPSHIGAGRPICPPCADSIDAAGAEPASTLKTPREDDRR